MESNPFVGYFALIWYLEGGGKYWNGVQSSEREGKERKNGTYFGLYWT
jgi:hypothetical protein